MLNKEQLAELQARLPKEFEVTEKCVMFKGKEYPHKFYVNGDFYGFNLQGIDLYGVNLKGANLWMANLRGAYLNGANLEGANLRGAILEGAYLRGAILLRADLRWAYLLRANLRWANLQGADLRWADLEGADLRGAYPMGLILKGLILKGAEYNEYTAFTSNFDPVERGMIFVEEEAKPEESEPLYSKETKNNIDEKIDDKNYDDFDPEVAKTLRGWGVCPFTYDAIVYLLRSKNGKDDLRKAIKCIMMIIRDDYNGCDDDFIDDVMVRLIRFGGDE